MFEFFLGHFSYWLTIVLLCIGLYGMLFKRSMVKKVVGLTIFQYLLSVACVRGASHLWWPFILKVSAIPALIMFDMIAVLLLSYRRQRIVTEQSPGSSISKSRRRNLCIITD